ncbi:MAG TPA: response regulator [Anaerolineales bacterium]|jgi:PleD family two-component response regulator
METAPRPPFVLIVEDSRDNAAYFRLVMDLAGYRTEIASDGRFAVELIYKKRPDVVMLDLGLPGLSGMEILQILRSDARLKKTHQVVVTAYSQLAADLQVEPDLILFKPVSPAQLTDLVGRLCQDDLNLEKRPFGKDPWEKTTGLHNRSFFTSRLNCALNNVRDDKDNLFGVLQVKVYPQGGSAPLEKNQELLSLREIGNSIKKSVRPTDTIARFGRDQFFILVENIHNMEILTMIADRIRPAISTQPAMAKNFSIGAVLCDESYQRVDEILKNVKLAQTLAKKDGRTHLKIINRPTLAGPNAAPLKLGLAPA